MGKRKEPVDTIGAANVLITKALGIGEDHTQKAGREFALSLLKLRISSNDNLVRRLFIEIPPYGQKWVNDAADLVKGPESLQDVLAKLNPAFDGVTNRETLKRVVATALLAGVKVYCADRDYGRDIEGRNETIAQKVIAVAQTDFSGCLLLFGSDHFDGAESVLPIITLCQFIDQMDWVKF